MISLKKGSSVGEITPVHLMSEEEAGERFRLSRENSGGRGADGKSVTQNNTAEHIAADSGKAHSKRRKHDIGKRENNEKPYFASVIFNTARSIRRWLKQDDNAEVITTLISIPAVAAVIVFAVVFLVCVSSPIKPTPNNLDVRTYSRSGIYKFAISDEFKMNGSENILCISISSIGTVELTESEYERYLGGDANAVSVTEYVIEAVANGEWGKNDLYYYGKRYVFPWSENAVPFSEEEKEYFAELICDDYENGYNIMEKLSLDGYHY